MKNNNHYSHSEKEKKIDFNEDLANKMINQYKYDEAKREMKMKIN